MIVPPIQAQDSSTGSAERVVTHAAEPSKASGLTTRDKWHLFEQQTFGWITLGAGAFNAGLSQATNTDPRYGTGTGALADRIGASVADNVSQSFFGDFLLASAFHEDPRYHRTGSEHGIVERAAYAISRCAIIRTDAGGESFNWSNFLGTAMSAGLSNAYYPGPSRTGGAMEIHFVTKLR